MTTIEQARAVEQRLRKCAVTEISPWEAADTIASLIAELEAAKKEAAKWKQMAEFQYAQRRYPDQLDLGQGALDAYFKGWAYDAAIAAGGMK